MTQINELTIEKLQSDIAYFKTEIQKHPGFTPDLQRLFSPMISNLRKQAPDLNRNDFILALTRVIGLFEDGHSYLPPFQFYN